MADTQDGIIRIGVAAMEKKARSKPMKQIMSRFDPKIFEFVIFGDEALLSERCAVPPAARCARRRGDRNASA